MPDLICGERRIAALEVEFRWEGSHRNVLESRCEGDAENAGTLVHALARHSDGKEVAWGRRRWR